MKAFNQRTTVLSYIASLLARKSPDALRLHQDVPSLAPAARLTREGLGADLGALRDLLIHHLDDLDAISAAVVQSKGGGGGDAKLGKQEFAAAVARAGVWMLPGEVDLLFRVYDADSSGFLEVSEVVAAHDRAAAR